MVDPTPELVTWASEWPDQITLGEAADEIDFDLMEGDDDTRVLVKRFVPLADIGVAYPLSMLDENDCEDRTERLRDGFAVGGRLVPPVVWVDGYLHDGNHRMGLAEEAGFTHVCAYTDE